MKHYSFLLQLLMLLALGASMNACMIANYQIVAQEPKEGRANLAAEHDDGPVYFVIPRYYQFHSCGGGAQGPLGLLGSLLGSSRSCRDRLGSELETGVHGALVDMSFGRQVEFTEHIPSQGLVCIITVNEQPVADATLYIELLGALTMGMSPVYATREYVLSYTLLLDFKTVREYQYTITRKAI